MLAFVPATARRRRASEQLRLAVAAVTTARWWALALQWRRSRGVRPENCTQREPWSIKE